jgi:hypothetical protein
MAMDIFTGTYLKVEVGSAGSTLATDFIVVDNVATLLPAVTKVLL